VDLAVVRGAAQGRRAVGAAGRLATRLRRPGSMQV
jgi:hypothetical protein